jgi:HEPN domain-containing protein
MSKRMLDRAEFTRWKQAAEDAGRAARVQADAAGHNWACFLAEQSAQLALKGILHGIGAGAWGHDLVALGKALEDALEESVPPVIQAALRRLSRHYIPARYPDAHPSGSPGVYYGREDSEQALDDRDLVSGFVDDIWRQLEAASGAIGE